MKGALQGARLVGLLTAILWFALSFGVGFASEQVAAASDHGAVSSEVHGVGQDVAAEGGHGEAQAHGSNSLSAAKLKDLGWRVVNFIALMIILVKFGAKPIGASLSARRNKIKDEIEDLQQKRAEAEKSYEAFQEKLSGVEAEIDKVVDRAVAQAEVEKQKIIEKAEQAADDITRSAEMAVSNEIAEARRILMDEVADQAAAMAEELIVKNLTADDQVKIIDNYLEKVGAVQ